MIKKIVLPFIICLVINDSFGQADIQFEQKGSWIDDIAAPESSEVSKYDVKSGAYYKLIDYQVDLDKSSYYSHFVFNVLSSGGASNVSRIEISYDSSYQVVQFHKLVIHRRGEQIDRTSEVTFEYIKNEQQLQSNIYTGDVTALAVLEDIRKDDWVEFSYTVVGNNPVFKKGRYFMTILDDINPVDRLFVKVMHPKDEKYNYRISDETVSVDETEENENMAIRIDRQHIDAVDLEETTPSWIIPFKYFEISNSNSWAEVNDWAMELFDKKDSDAVDEVLAELFYPDYTQEEKINAIIDFVQDEIRYMGIETGMGSIMPFSPNQVLKQRFGDCKDKSLLMATMMRKIGLECYPALVNSVLMEKIENHVPGGSMFDHVIVNFKYQGNDYWVDPTFSYQGGDYKTLTTFDYGLALIVKEGTTKLTDLGIEDNSSSTNIEEYLNVSSYTQPGKMKVTTTLRGSRADYTRQILEYYSLKELADYYKSYYSRLFPTLYEENRMKVNDDIESNQMTTIEEYLIPDIWKENQEGYEGKYTLNYHPINVYSYLSALSCEKKNQPVFQSHPTRFRQHTTIDFVEGLNIETEEKTVDNVAFTFTKKVELVEPTKVILEYSYETKLKEIDPEDFSKVCQDINEIVDNIPIIFYFPKQKFNLENLPFDLDFFEINLRNEPLTNQGYFIDSVENKVVTFNNIVGIVSVEKEDVTAAVLKDGIEAHLIKFLDSSQSKESNYTPLKLTVNKLQVNEKVRKKTQKAQLDFDYTVTFRREGKSFEYQLRGSLESEGQNARELHEKNIRNSLKQLLSGLSPEVFQVID